MGDLVQTLYEPSAAKQEGSPGRRRRPGESAIYLTLDTPLRSLVFCGRRLGGSSDIRG